MVLVNPIPHGHPPDHLAAVRNRALQATDVSFVITDASDPASPIVWVNEAFVRTTGYSVAEVLGRNPNLLHGPGTDRAEARKLGAAVAEGRPATVTLLNYRRDGRPFWNQVSVSPVPDADGRVTHWVGIQVDVTDQVTHASEQERSIEVERRARHALALVARASDLLADMDDPYVLHEVAALLRSMVTWAGFFLDDVELQIGEGSEYQLAGQLGAGRGRGPVAQSDVVQRLLGGGLEGPLELLLDPTAPGATGWLVRRLQTAIRETPRSVVVHAIQGRRRTLGLLVTVPHAGEGLDGLDENDRMVLELVNRRVGLAVDNARFYAREHRLAEALQRAMLPEQAEVADLDVWTYYAPSSGHAQVGGDWYDVLEVSPGVIAVVIGDVVGHDVEAAATMGQLRSVVRSYAFESDAPGAVLSRVDQLVAGMRVPRSASLVLAMLLRREEGWLLRYSRAGHLPPLLIRDGRARQLVGGGGSMIGFDGQPRQEAYEQLAAGDTLVLYTDGLIERRSRSLQKGLETLEWLSGRIGGADAAGVGEELLAHLADAPEDDVAVVVVRIPEPPGQPPIDRGAPRRRRWSLPSEPASIGRARHAVLRTCEAWGMPGAAGAELVVSELVANAVMHGWGHVVLRLFDTGDGLRIEVEDANPAPPVAAEGGAGRVGGFGMRIVERLADWGWRPSGDGKLVWARVRPGGPS